VSSLKDQADKSPAQCLLAHDTRGELVRRHACSRLWRSPVTWFDSGRLRTLCARYKHAKPCAATAPVVVVCCVRAMFGCQRRIESSRVEGWMSATNCVPHRPSVRAQSAGGGVAEWLHAVLWWRAYMCCLPSLDHPKKASVDKHEGVAGERVWEDVISGWVTTAGGMREAYHLCLWGRAALAPR
jgi:hypothetical protein